MKVVIVGGVAGGASAAARIRRLDEFAEIVVFERTDFISYANCGLPYYIGGVIEDEEALFLQTPQRFWERFNIKVRVRHEVIAIDPTQKTVTVYSSDTKTTYEEQYDKLLLSPGAKPAIPAIPGIENNKIFTLRTVEDTLAIKAFLNRHSCRNITIIGGGFIGLEMAENLVKKQRNVTIIEASDHLLGPLDSDMASIVHSVVRNHNIHLMLQSKVIGFEQIGKDLFIQTADHQTIRADMVLLAIGVIPDTKLAQTANLELGIKGSIVVDEQMRTSVTDIYAVGDAVEIKHAISGQKTLIQLAGPANKQGRIAADNICGIASKYPGAQGTSVLKFFDWTIASTGMNERQAKEAKSNYDRIVLSPLSHAGYYPGATTMTIKVLYDRSTLHILGAQIIGKDGVDKRIDVLATAMKTGLKGPELAELDLAYAPPYASAKDPIHFIGYMIENIATGKVKQFHYEEIDSLKQKGVTLLDTRTISEYKSGNIDGSIHIPLDELRQKMAQIPKDKPVYILCHSGLRSYLACRILMQNGYDCYNLSGGYRFYEMIVKGKKQPENTLACGIPKEELQ